MPLRTGVLVSVLVGVCIWVAFGPPRNRVFPLISALPAALTLSPFARGARLRRPSVLSALGRIAAASVARPPGSWSPVGASRRPAVRPEMVLLLSQTLTERDWKVLKSVNQLRLMTARQIERLHFWDLKEASRPVVRRRVLKRLSDAHVIIALPRRIGGNQRGSQQAMFALDAAGAQLLEQRENYKNPQPRNLTVPGALYYQHRIAVSEIFVRLQEMVRATQELLWVDEYQAEPECWWPYEYAEPERGRDGRPEKFVKPDAYLRADLRDAVWEHFWIEVDRGTESIGRVREKVELYAKISQDYRARKPHGNMPTILIITTTERRRDSLRKAIREKKWHTPVTYSGDSEEITLDQALRVRVECFDDALTAIMEELPQPGEERKPDTPPPPEPAAPTSEELRAELKAKILKGYKESQQPQQGPYTGMSWGSQQ